MAIVGPILAVNSDRIGTVLFGRRRVAPTRDREAEENIALVEAALAAGPIDPTDADLFEPAAESELSRAVDPLIEQAMQQSDEVTERKRDPEY